MITFCNFCGGSVYVFSPLQKSLYRNDLFVNTEGGWEPLYLWLYLCVWEKDVFFSVLISLSLLLWLVALFYSQAQTDIVTLRIKWCIHVFNGGNCYCFFFFSFCFNKVFVLVLCCEVDCWGLFNHLGPKHYF